MNFSSLRFAVGVACLVLCCVTTPVKAQDIPGPAKQPTAQDPSQYPPGPPGILARVGDLMVSEKSVNTIVEQQKRTMRRPPSADDSDLRAAALDLKILQAVIRAAAKKQKLEVSAKEVDAEVEKLGKARAGAPSQLEQLKRAGLTIDSIREACENRLLTRKLLAPELTPEAVSKFFEKHKRRYVRQLRVSHILIRPHTKERETEAQARQRAQRILKGLLEGKDWVAFARQESDEPMSAFDAGDLGWLYPNRRAQSRLVRAAQKLEIGEVCPEIITTRNGFHILKLVDARVPNIQFEQYDRKTEVRQDCFGFALKTHQQKWLKQVEIVRFKGATAPTALFPDEENRKALKQDAENKAPKEAKTNTQPPKKSGTTPNQPKKVEKSGGQ